MKDHVSEFREALQVKQRELQDAAQRASCQEFLRQAAFREYSRYLSFHFPFTHERSLLEHLRATPWKFNHRHFKVLHAAAALLHNRQL